MRKTGKIALCGIFGALSVMSLLLTVIPIATYCVPALAGIILLPIAKEVGIRWGMASYVVSAFLAFFICPDLEAKVLFITFFGYYPILKNLFDHISNKVVQWICKLLVFNLTIVGSYWILLKFLGLPMDSFELFNMNMPLIFLIVGNMIFVLLDYAIKAVEIIYDKRIHKIFLRVFK